MVKRKIIVSIIMFLICSVFTFSEELTLNLGEVEKYLGKPVPRDAQRIDLKIWIIEIFQDSSIRQDIILRTENNIVITAEYNFNAIVNTILVSLRGMLIDSLEQYGEFESETNDILFWNTSTLANRPVLVALSRVERGSGNTFYFTIALRLKNN